MPEKVFPTMSGNDYFGVVEIKMFQKVLSLCILVYISYQRLAHKPQGKVFYFIFYFEIVVNSQVVGKIVPRASCTLPPMITS